MKRHIKDQLLAARANETAVALVTDLTGGEQSLLTETSFQGDLALESDALDQARSMLHDERSGSLAAGERRLFVRVYSLPWRMVVVGAVHITQHLSPMATMAGYAVTIVDPRQAFATADRFPGQRLNTQWPDELFAAEPPDRHTAIVTLTHDPKIDDPALEVALRSPAFYVGSLGSRKTHSLRLERLAESGFGPDDVARIHAPIGLDLGGRSPAEIAVAVLAQVIQARHRGRR